MAHVMCRNPYVTADGKAFGCGQCLPCLINKRRIWTSRILLEAAQYEDNAFVTLTYDNDHLPLTDTGLHTLDRRDLKLWFMRLNTTLKRLKGPFPKSFRYFACGEYGDETERPHYHAILFGYPCCAYGRTERRFRGRCCMACELVRSAWGKGIIQVGTVEKDSAQYVAQYVTKKLTKVDDPRLNGRYPEFAVMSRMPGIGYSGLWEIADLFMRWHDKTFVDVYGEIRHNGQKWPMGRYLKRKLRGMVGREEDAPDEVIEQMVAEMSEVYAEARARATVGPRTKGDLLKVVFKNLVIDAGESKAGRQASRMKNRPRRRVL